MKVREEELVKALSEMEAIAKGGDKMPKNTAQANGGLSTEGDKTEMATQGGEQKVAKGGKKLSRWAKDSKSSDSDSESTSKACKAMKKDDESSESESSDEDSTSKAYKAMNAQESSDEESSEESSESSESSDDKSSTKAKKSTIANLMKSDSVAGPVVDVSPFIERLVDQVSEAEYDLRKSLVSFHEEQSNQNKSLRKAISAMGNLMLEINNRMKDIEDAPVGQRKSVLSKSEISERFEEQPVDFSKSMVLDALVDLTRTGQVSSLDVSRYEVTNTMEPNVHKAVEGYLRKGALA